MAGFLAGGPWAGGPVPGELSWQLADAEGTSALPVALTGARSRSGL
ncbi:hypothetical protein SSAG_02730 [Streptomyces sp. Mg1]|nr:hypothetical protein SSAG_02730 [Streptomyces sp. Mg1]